MSQPNVVTVESYESCVVITMHGEMDEARTRAMEVEVSAKAADACDRTVVLDLSNVECMPSLSLGALITLLQESRKRNQRFVLAGVQLQVRDSLAITHLSQQFETYDTVEVALRELQSLR